jgi:hypothetical protein
MFSFLNHSFVLIIYKNNELVNQIMQDGPEIPCFGRAGQLSCQSAELVSVDF